MLRVEGLSVSYDRVRAVNGVSVEARQGDLVSLIGANGAGKTTLLKAIMGALVADAGEVLLAGAPLSRAPVEERVRRGMNLVPEKRALFNSMTVQDNLELGTYTNRRKVNFAQELKRIYKLFPILDERKAQLAGTLSGGEQQMVAIGRALIARPKLLLLDEPSIGLAPLIVQQIMDVLLEHKRQEGLTIVLVEQNARLALRLAHRAYVLERGEVVRTGTGQQLLEDDFVRRAYLGV